jgi:hypothetical protein
MISWEEYLYRQHSREEIRRWALSLKFFRFCRAYGGHNNDGDRLSVSLVATAETREIPGAYVSGDRVLIMLSDGYEVTQSTVDSARALEVSLRPEWVIDPPQDDEHCFCPEYHPWIWQNPS